MSGQNKSTMFHENTMQKLDLRR